MFILMLDAPHICRVKQQKIVSVKPRGLEVDGRIGCVITLRFRNISVGFLYARRNRYRAKEVPKALKKGEAR